MLEHKEIIIAFIGAVSAVIGSYFLYRASMAKTIAESVSLKADQTVLAMNKEMNLSATALSGFGGLMYEFSQVEQQIRELCYETSVNRVVILCAWNGKYNPKWTSAVWQYRVMFNDDGTVTKPVGYVHVGLDNDYVQRILHIKRDGSMLFKTDDAPDSLIKRIYEAEGVEESLWCFLSSTEVPQGGGRLITYMSFSTTEGVIDNKTRLACELLANKLAPLTGTLTERSD